MATRGRTPKSISAQEQYLGQDQTLQLGERPSHEDIDLNVNKKIVDMEAFMNERVVVLVNSSGVEGEANVICVGVNGVMQYIKRDMKIAIKRKFVEALSRSKSTTFNQDLDERQGDKMNQVHAQTTLRIPFQVVRDDNPLGHEWLAELLAQPN